MPAPLLFDLRPDTRELEGVTFECLPGCGWCCLQPAEVSPAEGDRLRARKPNVKLGFDGERTFLRLQGGCGACQMLDADRMCTVYEDRPNHCRWFPFHVYFGRRVEVVVNRSCPGVVDQAGASVLAQAQVALATADPAVVRRHVEESAATHAAFRANCEEAGAWDDVDDALAQVISLGPEVFTRAALEQLADAPARDLAEHAASQFDAADPGRRPYLSDPQLRWMVWQRRKDRYAMAELAPAGRLDIRQVVHAAPWEDLPEDVRYPLWEHLARLLRRESFAGGVFDRVDDSEYTIGVAQAAREEAAIVAAELALRARLLAQIAPRPDPAAWALEARKFYDSDFLDRPAIGAWL